MLPGSVIFSWGNTVGLGPAPKLCYEVRTGIMHQRFSVL